MTIDTELDQLLGPEVEASPAPKPELTVVTVETPHPLAAQWAKWKPEFAKAMDGSYRNIEGLEKLVFQGRVQFWPGAKAAIITEIQVYTGGEKALQGLWAAGDLSEVLTLIPGVESFGRLHGCTSVLVEGQAGWARALKPLGYAQWSVTVRKPL